MTNRLKRASLHFRDLLLLFLMLMVLSTYSQNPIVAMEYYIDTDPGIGGGMAIAVSSGVDQDVDITIGTSGFSIGFHELVVRARYSDGTWGIQESRVFYVSQSSLTTNPTITAMEYFFDTDPGIGNGTALTVTSGVTVDTDAIISTALLAAGFHELVIRTMNSDGLWGTHRSQVFYIDALKAVGANANLTGIEYFIDSDPGVGAGTEIVISPSQASIDRDVTLATGSLTNGDYTVGVRVSNGDGSYSLTEMADFQICTGANTDFSATTVCEGESTSFTDLSTETESGDIYSWDFDGDGNEDDATVGNTSFTYSTAGTYTATLSIDRAGCAVSKELEVTVVDVPNTNAGNDQNITVDNTTLAATAAATGETGIWSLISGTGSFGDVNNPTTTVSGLAIGETVVRWTITTDVASCTSFDELTITRTNDVSSDTDILSFSLQEQSSPAEIDAINHTVSILVELSTDLTNLNPTISVSDGAMISPMGAQDFSSTVTYTVTAEDLITTQDWAVTVMERPLGLNDTFDLTVHPNPVSDKLLIAGIKEEYQVRLTDLMGKVLVEGENLKELAMVAYKAGTYLLTITIDGRTQSVRIIRSN